MLSYRGASDDDDSVALKVLLPMNSALCEALIASNKHCGAEREETQAVSKAIKWLVNGFDKRIFR
jgi:hypothetical protein